jgi:hypothetical protein
MKNRKAFDASLVWVTVLAVAAGFIGGIIAVRLSMDRPALASEPAKEIKAQSFQLVDGHGSTHAALSIMEGGGPGLEFYDSDHRPRVVFDITGKGDPRLFLIDAEGTIRTILGLGLGADGRPFMRLRDKDGQVIWSVPQPTKE